MSSTTVATTASPISETSSALSSAAPSTSAQVSSGSSTSPAITTASSSNDPPPTSTQASSAPQTTPSTTTSLTTTQLQTPSSTIATSEQSTTISSSSTSTSTSTTTDPSTSNVPSTTTSSSPSPSQSSSPAGNDIPLTTVLESTTIFVTATNSQGQVVTSAPPMVTEVITTTGTSGVATTVTQAVVNPTLSSNDSTSGGSSFFSDTGAVVGVFVVVGLASASILLWMLFAIRRSQRMRSIEQDSVIEAAVTAAGFNRAPLDDGDGDSPISPNTRQFSRGQMDQRVNLSLGGSDSLPTSSHLSEAPDDPARGNASSHRGFHVVHRTRSHPEGYIPARTTSPPSGNSPTIGSSRDRKSSYGHTPTYSAGSFEPLLANYAQNTTDQDIPPVEGSQNPSSRPPNGGPGPNESSSGETPEDLSRRRNSPDGSVLQEVEEYAHYVLMVRNLPDDQSHHSE